MVVNKTTNRHFYNILFSIIFLHITGCYNSHNQAPIIAVHWPDTGDTLFNNTAAHVTEKAPLEIDKAYKHQTPIASLVNMCNFCDTSIPFTIEKSTPVKILAVGEMMTSLAKVSPKYYFGNDDLELYFATKTDAHPFSLAAGDQQYIFNWIESVAGGLHSGSHGIGYKKEIDSVTHCIKTEITIPWSHFKNFIPTAGKKLRFDFAAGDNDDGIRQKGKIAWNSRSDSFLYHTKDYGFLCLTNNSAAKNNTGLLYSFLKTTDTINWQAITPCNAVQVVAGNEIKNIKDCSAEIKSCWDKQNIYFNIRVIDVTWGFRERFITNTSRQNLPTFFDHGWIEDNTGKPVWNMSVLHSRHAGGAIKNQLIDTIIRLTPGRYRLRYITDESHAYNTWDDAPPLTPFYGIRLYRAQHP